MNSEIDHLAFEFNGQHMWATSWIRLGHQFCYKGDIWRYCICEATMPRSSHLVYCWIIRMVPYLRFYGCIGYYLPTILVATKTTYSWCNAHLVIIKATLYQLKKVGFDEVWVLNFFLHYCSWPSKIFVCINIQTMST
jgi:hypothetical protein